MKSCTQKTVKDVYIQLIFVMISRVNIAIRFYKTNKNKENITALEDVLIELIPISKLITTTTSATPILTTLKNMLDYLQTEQQNFNTNFLIKQLVVALNDFLKEEI